MTPEILKTNVQDIFYQPLGPYYHLYTDWRRDMTNWILNNSQQSSFSFAWEQINKEFPDEDKSFLTEFDFFILKRLLEVSCLLGVIKILQNPKLQTKKIIRSIEKQLSSHPMCIGSGVYINGLDSIVTRLNWNLDRLKESEPTWIH